MSLFLTAPAHQAGEVATDVLEEWVELVGHCVMKLEGFFRIR